MTAGANNIKAGYNGFQKTVDVFGYNYKPHGVRKVSPEQPDHSVLRAARRLRPSARAANISFPWSKTRLQGRADFQVSSYDLYAPRWATAARRRVQRAGRVPVHGRRVRLDGLRLSRRADAIQRATRRSCSTSPTRPSRRACEGAEGTRQDHGAFAQLVFRHRRSGRLQERPLLHLSGALAARSADGAHPAALELARTRWAGDARPRLHLRRRGGVVSQRPFAGPEKKAQFEYRLRWDDVKYEPGELRVVAYKDGRAGPRI